MLFYLVSGQIYGTIPKIYAAMTRNLESKLILNASRDSKCLSTTLTISSHLSICSTLAKDLHSKFMLKIIIF